MDDRLTIAMHILAAMRGSEDPDGESTDPRPLADLAIADAEALLDAEYRAGPYSLTPVRDEMTRRALNRKQA